jgi:hypothetical protein
MSDRFIEAIKNRFRAAHQRFFKMLEGVTDDQFRWRPTPVAHSIAFQVWHGGRVNDYFQSKIPGLSAGLTQRLGPGRQIWEVEDLAKRWGLDPAALGWNEIGFGMDDTVAANLALPSRDVVVDYARRALATADRSVEALTDEDFHLKMVDWAGELPLGAYVLEYLAHDEWDIGQIACLRRAQGLPRVMA